MTASTGPRKGKPRQWKLWARKLNAVNPYPIGLTHVEPREGTRRLYMAVTVTERPWPTLPPPKPARKRK